MENGVDLKFSSGIPGLDGIIQSIDPGDNIVFQIDSIDDYVPFVHPFCYQAEKDKKDLIYLRFAQHNNLMPENIKNFRTYILSPEKGFDFFISQIIDIIEKHGIGACYVFDSLSDLAVDWYSNVMLGNFFMLICPYLYDYKTVTYFGLFRHHHDSETFRDIHNTAQVIINIYHDENKYLFVHPLKVVNRFSPTIFMLHKWEDKNLVNSSFKTIKESATTAKILSEKHYQWLDYQKQRQKDAWHITFEKAQKTLEGLILGEISLKEANIFKSKLLKKAVVQSDRLFLLAMQYIQLEDLLKIRKRMIGTGFIGGKSFGMLLARAILKEENSMFKEKLEIQDSFYIGSDVFYTYLVKNKCWWLRRKLSHPNSFLEGLKEAEQKIIDGFFPKYIINRFTEMLDYFGQSPIIVRSSSLLEDAYGNSFSGKYESVFCANQGTPKERLEDLINAIKVVYKSAIGCDALTYRQSRGLLEKDEQMAVLVQRVSGSFYGDYFFPQAAGVGFSFNPYVWNEQIDPNSGFLRLVFGLGTRAVGRMEDDFTRLVALNTPTLRIESTSEEIRKISQKKVDLLNLKENKFVTLNFMDMNFIKNELPLEFFASWDSKLESQLEKMDKKEIFPWVITFQDFLKNTNFAEDMKLLLNILEKTYQNPVDIEFTVNFFENNEYKINLVQCRPFQIKNEIKKISDPEDIDSESIILKSSGPIIGTSITKKIDRIIYIVPKAYGEIPIRERYSIARLIGQINRLEKKSQKKIMLLGPGRWGTSTPSLGIPVNFAEINNISIICEIAEMRENLIPDVSLGTHFFNNLVELDILYYVINPNKEGNVLNREFFENTPNSLGKLIPEAKKWEQVIKIIDIDEIEDLENQINVYMNSFTQKGICYLTKNHL
ncbi:MAG: pyruvate, phosphate dikinase [archaeon]|nr:pyruvate, phosphate dikinase [archaeon]